MSNSGIYVIENSVNGRVYIGSAAHIGRRWSQHRSALRKGTHYNGRLQNAWNKYGEHQFAFAVVELVLDIEQVIPREQFWIDLTGCLISGYNIAPTAGSMRGFKQDPATVKRLADAMRGTKLSPDACKRISEALKGKPKSAEHAAKVGAWHKGRTFSEAHRAKLSAAAKVRVRAPLSEATKAKIAAAQIGKSRPKHTPEQARKRSASLKASWAARRAQQALTGEAFQA
jgi:group I intron endonuclease